MAKEIQLPDFKAGGIDDSKLKADAEKVARIVAKMFGKGEEFEAVEAKVKSLDNAIAKVGSTLENVRSKLDLEKSVKVPTAEYKELQGIIASVEKELAKNIAMQEKMELQLQKNPVMQQYYDLNEKLQPLYAQREQLKSEGVSPKSKEFVKLQSSIYPLEAELEKIQPKVNAILAPMELIERKINDQKVDLQNLNTELSEMTQAGKAFTSGGDPSKISSLEAQEQALVDKNNQLISQRQTLAEAQAQYVAKQIDIKANAGEINSKIADTVSRYKEVEEEIKRITTRQNELEGAGRGLGYSEYDNNLRTLEQLKAEQAQLNQQLADYRSSVSGTGEGMSRWQAILSSVKNGFASILGYVRELPGHLKIFDRLHSVAQSIKGHFKNMGKHMQDVANNAKKSATHLGKTTLKIAKALIGVRGLYMLVRKIRAAIKEGIENLSKAEQLTEGKALKDNLDTLKAKFTQLKNSIGAAFAPLIEVVTPIISKFVDTLTQAFNSVAMFFGALTGAKTVAVAKILDKDAVAAENLGKKQKEANKQLAKFDELNNITTNNDNDSDTSNMFESVEVPNKFFDLINKLKDMWKNADFTELGKKLGEALKRFLDNIPWKQIQDIAYKIGKSLATFINGLINVAGLGYSIGKTFAEMLNTIFHALYGFIHNLDWKALGHFIADGLNGLFENIDWDLIYKTFTEGAQGLVDMINQFITDFHWDNISTTIANALNTITATIKTFFQGVHWGELGYNLGTQLVETIKKIKWEDVGAALGSILRAAFDFLVNFVKGLINGDIGSALLTALGDFFKGLFEGLGIGDIFESVFGEGSFIGSIISIGETIARNLFGGITKWIETDGPGIQESFLNIFDIWGKIGEDVSLYFSDISDIFSAWGGTDGQKITADIIGIFTNGFTFIIEYASQFISDLISLIVEPIHEHKEEYQHFFEDVLHYASETWDFIKGIFDEVINTLETVYNDHIAPLFDTLKEVISGALDAIFAVWNDTLKPVIDGIVEEFPEIKATVVPVIHEIGDAVGAFIDMAVAVVKSLYESLKPIVEWIHEHVGPVIKDTLLNGWNVFKTVFSSIMDILKPFISFIKDLFKLITDLVNGDWKAAWKDCKSIFSDAITFIENLIKGFINIIKTLFTKQASDAKGWGNDLTSNLAGGITGGLDKVKTAVSGVADKIRSFLHFSKPDEGPLADFDKYMPDMMKGLADGIKANMNLIENMMQHMTATMSKMLNSLDMSKIGLSFAQALASGLNIGMKHVSDMVKQMVVNMSNMLKSINWSSIGTSISQAIANGLQSGINSVFNAMRSLTNSMHSAIGNLANQAYRWGADMMVNLINGIYAMWSNLVNAVSNVATTIWNYLHFSEPEVGPLKNFHTFMPDMMDSMVSGIEQGIPDVEAVLNKLSYGIAGGVTLPPKMAQSMGQTMVQSGSSIDADTLSTILSSALGGLNLNSGSQQDTSDIVIQIDGNEIFRAVRNENNSYIKRTGRSAFTY